MRLFQGFLKNWLGLGLLAAVLAVGVFRAWSHGANDFLVFFQAWRLVLEGHGEQIYHVSTDRFLYAPGFAWLLSPFALMPLRIAFSVWCSLKILIILFLIRKLSTWGNLIRSPGDHCPGDDRRRLSLTVWGIVMLSRPLLIDLEYGQVNLFIVGASIWALCGHFDQKTGSFWDVIRWAALSFAALAKLFPLPLLIVPWIVSRGIKSDKLRYERAGVVLGVLFVLGIPLLNQGWAGTFELLVEWRDAVLARGLPLETHNQSFSALLHHYLSGSPTPIHSEGGGPLMFGLSLLSLEQIGVLSLAWTLLTMGLTLGWIIAGSQHSPIKWIAIAVGLLIVPSHLIWKPYFVMSIPLSVLIVQNLAKKRRTFFHQFIYLTAVVGLFIGINLTGFDFVGHLWSAHFEAASVLLLMHLILVMMAFSASEEGPVLGAL